MLQPRSNFPKAVTCKILFKYPTHYFGFWVHRQFTIRANFISIAFAVGHFGTAVLEPFSETVLDCFVFCVAFILKFLSKIKIPQ